MQGAAKLPRLRLRVQQRRLLQRLRCHHGNVRVQLRIIHSNAGQQRFRQLRRSDRPVMDPGRRFKQRKARELIAKCISSCRLCKKPRRPIRRNTAQSNRTAAKRSEVTSGNFHQRIASRSSLQTRLFSPPRQVESSCLDRSAVTPGTSSLHRLPEPAAILLR